MMIGSSISVLPCNDLRQKCESDVNNMANHIRLNICLVTMMQFLNQLGQMLKMQSCHHISNLNRRNQCKNMVWYIRNLYKMLCCRREAMRLSICSWVQQYNTMRPLLVLLLVTSNKNLPMCTNNFCLSA